LLCLFIPTRGSFLLEDLYKLNLSATEQLWIFLAFSVMLLKLIYSILGKQMCTKSACCRNNVARIMLKMDYSIIRWQLPIVSLQQKEYMYIFISLGIAGVIYWFHCSFRQKDLKVTLYSSLAHVGLIAAGPIPTIDGLRGAVLQMIAHGFVVVGLFFISDIIFRRYETRTIAEMGGIRTQSPKCFDVLTFSISFSCSSYYFQLC
jgi:NADH-quinone oxidoreductase subunit M